MSHISQIYCKAPSKADLEQDLLEQGLATELEDGSVQPKISLTTWTPVKEVDDPETDTDERQEADYILCLVGWTSNSMQAAGLSQSEVDSLLDAGTLANGTEVDVDVTSLDLHESEPKLTTYGA